MKIEDIIREKHLGDKEQLDFIFSNEEKIIVTAPAGCGKTTSMISKIARELSCGNIPPNKKILAMTFSVNAAMKIKDSLKLLMPNIVQNYTKYLDKVDVANYHNFAMRLLSKYGYYLNSEFSDIRYFKITNENNEEIKRNLTNDEFEIFKGIDEAIKNCDKEYLLEKIDNYWEVLNKKLISNHIITYNGILISAIILLRNNQITSFYKKYYRMIIVDEFQDTNILGYLLLEELIDDNITIFLGDDIQKIYGFIGAMNGIFETVYNKYNATKFEFKNNYRFESNNEMKQLSLLIRDCAQNYKKSKLSASILLKKLDNDIDENKFIIDGVKKLTTILDGKVAILIRARWQGESISEELDKNAIKYFNALYNDTDSEVINFYNIAIDEFHKNVNSRANQLDLQKCLNSIKERRKEVDIKDKRKYVFDSMYKLLEILFLKSKEWEGTLKDKYENIKFILANNGLKHMMEFIDEPVILTTIHSAKGLEWDYVILPRLNAYVFPSSRNVCQDCKKKKSCIVKSNNCNFLFKESMEKKFKEEINIFYVAITRAKKNVFMTVNNHYKDINCFLNLDGIEKKDYDWDIINNL